MQKKINKKNQNNKTNLIIIVGIIILLGALILMFLESDKTDNYIKEISYNEYNDIIKKDEYSIVLLTNPDCSHCISYKPFVNYLAKENNLNVYNINLTSITYEEYNVLHDKYSATKDQYRDGVPVIPTPTTLIVKNGIEITSALGDIGYNGLERLLKNNNVIE